MDVNHQKAKRLLKLVFQNYTRYNFIINNSGKLWNCGFDKDTNSTLCSDSNKYRNQLCFSYISDASRGAVLVHEIPSGSEWSAIVCQLAVGLQLALVKRGPLHSILILNRLHQHGLFELDTGALRRKNSMAPLRGYYLSFIFNNDYNILYILDLCNVLHKSNKI